MKERMDFLKKDLNNLFNDRGVDQSQYDQEVNFMDPITKYSSVKGRTYLSSGILNDHLSCKPEIL